MHIPYIYVTYCCVARQVLQLSAVIHFCNSQHFSTVQRLCPCLRQALSKSLLQALNSLTGHPRAFLLETSITQLLHSFNQRNHQACLNLLLSNLKLLLQAQLVPLYLQIGTFYSIIRLLQVLHQICYQAHHTEHLLL